MTIVSVRADKSHLTFTAPDLPPAVPDRQGRGPADSNARLARVHRSVAASPSDIHRRRGGRPAVWQVRKALVVGDACAS